MDHYLSQNSGGPSELIKKVEANKRELTELIDAADAVLAENAEVDEEGD